MHFDGAASFLEVPRISGATRLNAITVQCWVMFYAMHGVVSLFRSNGRSDGDLHLSVADGVLTLEVGGAGAADLEG